ncbi:hypothetical protein GCM10023350_00400 [Nocardioides endophyticus]|uniref:Adenylate kinase n=1 Tax=Nocardioides endophyticus TaxID=1353775 RepID=A0ABP8Y6W7_9ACTN
MIHRRLALYAVETDPLVDIYRTRALAVEVDGAGVPSDVTRRIVVLVREQRSGAENIRAADRHAN